MIANDIAVAAAISAAKSGDWLPAVELWSSEIDLTDSLNAMCDRDAGDICPPSESSLADAWSAWTPPIASEIIAACLRQHADWSDTDEEDATVVARFVVSDAIEMLFTAAMVAQKKTENDAEIEAWSATQDRIDAVCEAIEQAAGIQMSGRRGSSRYAIYRASIKIRVSDHAQVDGGGWCEQRQDRRGEADCGWVIDSANCPIPTRAEIRQTIAAALFAAR